MVKRYFSVAMLIIGTIIGAGFASGREIVSFFGKSISPLIALVCAGLIFVSSVLFLSIGKMVKSTNVSGVNVKLVGKFHIVADIFLLLNSLIVLAGMLAGIDSLGSMIFPLSPLYSVAFGIIGVLVVCKGINGLLKCNSFIVPVIIICLIAVCFFNLNFAADSMHFSIKALPIAVIYISMNMMLASTVLTTIQKLDFKTIIFSSLIASVVMGVLMLLIILAMNGSAASETAMPILNLAKKTSPIIFGLVVITIAISIFTTLLTAMSGLTSWLETVVGDKISSAIIVLL